MSPFGDPSSAWWYLGTLGPEHATGFNVQEVVIQDGGRIEVYDDRIGVWSRPPGWAVSGPEEARELIALVVGAYALISGVPLEWSLDGWVEATEARIGGSALGTIIDRRGRTASPMKLSDSLESRRMLLAAEVAIVARTLPGFRLALRDVHAALELDQLARSDDAFVFAHRALAGVARAVSDRARGDVTPGDWRRLAAHLGVEARDFEARKEILVRARAAAAHGDEDDSELAYARARRSELVNDARLLAVEAFRRDPRFDLQPELIADEPVFLRG